jgi:hypothetical protein
MRDVVDVCAIASIVLVCLIVGFNIGEGMAKIPPEQIATAQKICGDRGIEFMAKRVLKCKDGARYEYYYKEKE